MQSARAQLDATSLSMLTSGWWHINAERPAYGFVFEADGSFYYGMLGKNGSFQVRPSFSGRWNVSGKSLIMNPRRGGQTTYSLPVDPTGMHGVDGSGEAVVITRKERRPKVDKSGPPVEAPIAEATPTVAPISPEAQQNAARLIQMYHDSLVFVNGREGAGSGFIATIGNANFLVTNAHVEAGIRDAEFKTLGGTVVQGGAASMAIGEDIYCMALQPGGKPFQVMEGVDANAAIGDDVVVLGNAEGAGVVNTIIGKIVGIGANLVEVDAPFVPGNSGSPIVHLKTGKVIGVATYTTTNQYDLTTDRKLAKPVVRRFGYRLDNIKKWQAVNPQAFAAQAITMENIATLTNDLYDFFKDLRENKGRVTPGRHTNPVIKTRIDDWLDAKSHHPSASDIEEADANFISFLKVACETDVTAAQGVVTYDYFQRELADQRQARGEMAKAFEEILKVVRE